MVKRATSKTTLPPAKAAKIAPKVAAAETAKTAPKGAAKAAGATTKGAAAAAAAVVVDEPPAVPPPSAGPPVDPILEACRPIVQALRGGADVPDEELEPATLEGASTEMLIEGLPHALKAPPAGERRHPWQEKMLDAVAACLADEVVGGKLAAVRAAEAALEALDSQKVNFTANLERLAAQVAEETSKRDASKDEVKAKQTALGEATTRCEAVKQKHEGVDQERQALLRARDEHETGLAELWPPLKASELDGPRWREREKLLKVLMERMAQMGIDKSLLAALPVALKVREDQRRKFGQVVVERAEEVYAAHIDELKRKLAAWEQNNVAVVEEIGAAEAGVEESKAAVQAASEASDKAEKVWAEVIIAEANLQKDVNEYDTNKAALDKRMAEAKSEHACAVELGSHFAALRAAPEANAFAPQGA